MEWNRSGQKRKSHLGNEMALKGKKGFKRIINGREISEEYPKMP
jgi:hypothetical protein